MSLAALRDEPAGDITIVGTWSRPRGSRLHGDHPPGGHVLRHEFVVQERRYVDRPVVTHVQNAVQRRVRTGAFSGREPEESSPDGTRKADLRWREHGIGTGAIMSGMDLVASFDAEFLVADKYLQNQPPDRGEEMRRRRGGHRDPGRSKKANKTWCAWVSRKWQAQLDTWSMSGEPSSGPRHQTS